MIDDVAQLTAGDCVEAWRFGELLAAGYPVEIAEQIAASDVDLHQAVDLVTRNGCPHDLAAKILL